MRMLLGVAVLAGAVSPALADVPPHVFKAQYELRISNQDGRGDRVERPSPIAEKFSTNTTAMGRPAQDHQATRQMVQHAVAIPMKAEYRNRLENAGLDPDGALADKSSIDAKSTPSSHSSLAPGRISHGVAMPLKNDVRNKLSAAGQNPDALGDKAHVAPGAQGAGSKSLAASQGRMTVEQRKSLCAHAGICKAMPELVMVGEADAK